MKIIYVLSVALLFQAASCFADQESTDKQPTGQQPASQQSKEENPQPREYLPGEEVVTESGQKLKVWSTRGPVPVSKAPEPFKDDEEQDIDVILDVREGSSVTKGKN